jgi:hypothetical protein
MHDFVRIAQEVPARHRLPLPPSRRGPGGVQSIERLRKRKQDFERRNLSVPVGQLNRDNDLLPLAMAKLRV